MFLDSKNLNYISKIFLNFQKFFHISKIFLNFQKFFHISKILSNFQNFSKFSKFSQITEIFQIFKICPNFPNFVPICPKFLEKRIYYLSLWCLSFESLGRSSSWCRTGETGCPESKLSGEWQLSESISFSISSLFSDKMDNLWSNSHVPWISLVMPGKSGAETINNGRDLAMVSCSDKLCGSESGSSSQKSVFGFW